MDTVAMERARFRLQQLAAHLPSEQDTISLMTCMGTMRRDGRVSYARAATNDARFMRPVQLNQVGQHPPIEVVVDSPSLSAGSARTPMEAVEVEAGKCVPPLFSKPIPPRVTEPVGEPLFARSSLPMQEQEKEKEAAALAWVAAEDQPAHPHSDCIGFEWFPRMDVVESGTAYVITVELPGVSVEGICVEVDHGSLVITGNRATDWWKNGGGNGHSNGGVYHRQELAQGPYRAVWRLPRNGDVSAITAEFIDGFLRVLVPKTRVVRYI